MSDGSRKIVVAIDGPSGAGKSTVCKALANELGLRYLDTGAMYRALALRALRAGIGDEDGEQIASLMLHTEISFGHGEPQPVYLDGEDISIEIRTQKMAKLASDISKQSPVRRALVERQQEIVAEGGYALEGRDTTTVVAPDAEIKIYLTASLEERARRRLEDFKAAGQEESFDKVRLAIENRDHQDINRQDSPLKVAPGAVIIDGGCMTASEVVEKIKSLVPPPPSGS